MNYDSEIVALYEGEMYGEHLFELLADSETDSRVAPVWRRIADVERLTGARLRPLAARFDPALDVQQQAGRARAAQQAAQFAGQSWREIMDYYVPRVPPNVARVRGIKAAAPVADQPALEQFIAHSEAFGHCIGHCLRDDPGAGLAALDAYLAAHRVAPSAVAAAGHSPA